MKDSFILLLFFTPALLFGQFRSGENVAINKPQESDIYIAGGNLTVSSYIAGDLVAAGGEIYIYDSIGQDLIIAGGKISVKGDVGDDVRCAGGTVDFEGKVNDDMIVFGGEVTIGPNAKIGGDLLVYGGKVKLLGNVTGNVKASGGEITLSGVVDQDIDIQAEEFRLNGTVKGNVKLATEELFVDQKARVEGNFDYWTEDGDVDIPQGVVSGSVNYVESLKPTDSDFDWPMGGSILFFLSIGYILAVFLIILVFHLLFGKQFIKAAASWKTDFSRSLGYGTLYLLGCPLIIALLMATIIGIPLGLFLLSFYIFSFVFGLAIGSLLLVNYYNEYEDRNWNKGMVVIMALVAAVLIRIITLIPLIGWLIGLLFIVSTFGAFIVSWVGTSQPKMQIQ